MPLSKYRSFSALVLGLALAPSCASVPKASPRAQIEPHAAGESSPSASNSTLTPLEAGPAAGATWRVAPARVGAYVPRVIGSPQAAPTPLGPATCFDGKKDGLVLAGNPLAGWREFTLQVLFRPDAGGPAEQRFVHVQEDGTDSRAMVETRVTPDGYWYLDTFLRSPGDKLALIDPEQRHPTDRWYWVALSYDGKTMRHYVSGQLEGEGKLSFQPLGPGRTSLGMRINEVHWFQGCIAELRYDPRALPPGELESVRGEPGSSP